MQKQLINEQIIVVGFPAWEGDYLKSTVQLVSELAKNNEVLYVEYPFTWKDVIWGRLDKSKAPWRRILGKEERLRNLRLDNGASVNVLTLPPMVPVNFIGNEQLYDSLMSLNASKAGHSIKAAAKGLGFHKPVVVNAFNPFLGVFLARQLDEKALIYYCYDEISAAKWAGKHGARLERQLIKQADAVITSSKPLFEAKKPVARRSFLIKNGVDFDLFSTSGDINQQTTNNKKQKTIGYLGSLDERVDYDLLEQVITLLPNRKFVFVGRVNSPEAERLRHFSNVEIMGSQPPATLPQWVQRFGVCMIPFVKNKLTAGIYPLKINEYFAAGKPVVTTSFGDLSDFQRLVSIADTPVQFAAALEKALQNANDDNNQAHRIAFAHGNSWSQRAAEMGVAISQVITENRLVAATSNDFLWMPDNYNRGGEVSAAFFGTRERQSSPYEVRAAYPAMA